MKRKIIIVFKSVFVLLIIVFFNNSFAYDLSPAQIFELVNNKVVVIISYDFNKKPLKQGSGVVINDSGYIVTNFHVFSECENIVIFHNEIEIGKAEIIDADMDQDILVLKVENLDLQGIQIGNSDNLIVGEVIFAVGSPLGYENTISEGIVSGIRNFNNGNNLVQITASISEGSSGGAIVNSEGDLIGISTFQEKKGQNINFAIPINTIIEFKNSISYEVIHLESRKLFIKGFNAFTSGKYEEALFYFNEYLKIYTDGTGFFNRGIAYLELEKFNEAILDFSNAITNDYAEAKVYNSRGRAYLEKGDYSLALSDFNYSILLEPESPVSYNQRGKYYLITEDFKNALKDFSKAISLNDGYSMYYYNRGLAYEYLKKNINAIDDYTQALKLYPDYYDAYYSRALLFSKIGNYEKAIIDFQKCIEMYPDYKYPYNNLGWAYFNNKDYKNAIYYLEKCVALDDNNWDAILGIAATYFVIGNKEKAEKYFYKAVRIEPRLKNGMEGLLILEKEGFSYKKSQKKIIKELFDEFI